VPSSTGAFTPSPSGARDGAGARVALQPGRSAAGDGVQGVAGVVRAVLGGEPGAAQAAGRGEVMPSLARGAPGGTRRRWAAAQLGARPE